MSFVIESGSKQFLVDHKQNIIVDRLTTSIGDMVEMPVLFDTEGKLTTVTAKVIAHEKAEKIKVVKYKSKSNYHKQYGHRSYTTQLEIQ